ncbi:MAG TPA: RluA family pseudouridine synthase [Hellea balneolensis]|uniref:Pseudouridine synthase n=1 Tax=Hellea balneolensis TaxID=287478 RepID=A0A7C5R0A6_9PROT|nr:RluA family pseudouridine synthase [Hellea balneolensis]
MSAVQVITVEDADAGVRLDRWFKRRFPHIAHGRVEKLLRTGQIRVEGKRAKGNVRLETGQAIRIPPLPDPTTLKPVPSISTADQYFMQSLVLYQDDELIALNKPAGLAVQGGTNTKRHIDGLLLAFGEGASKPRLVHRLDRDTSGVLIVAKTAASAKWIGRTFQSRRTEKIYWGITNGVPRPSEGEIKGYIAKGEDKQGRELMQAVRHGSDGAKHAVTLYQNVSEAGKRAAWVVMKPLSGRKHQLRLHMQLLGTPLVGDSKYLTDREPPGGLAEGLYLHARSLRIPRPDGQDLFIEADLPPHFNTAFSTLGFDAGTPIEPFE